MFHNDWIPIKRILLFSVIIIILIIGISLFFNITEEYDSVFLQAKQDAEASYNKDLIYRRWASMHGGVYVPISEKTKPNPNLSHIPERDITTPSGKQLTLMNPAFMTRQVHEIQEGQYGVKGHITSLNPIRPENKADIWETQALQLFEKGVKEYCEITEIDNEKYLRFMRPMMVEASCLKCHAKQGYKLGDIRGGISTSVPMLQYDQMLYESIMAHGLTHFFIALCFLIFSFFSYKKLRKEVYKRSQSQLELVDRCKELSEINNELVNSKKQIEENEKLLKAQNEEYHSLNEELSESNARIKKYNEELKFAKDKAEESDRLKSAFLANVSHEIRTPMNGIIGFSELLQKRNLSYEKQSKYTELIKNNSLQLLGIINDILDISKIEAGQVSVQNEVINFNSFLKDVYSFFEPKINEKNLIFKVFQESANEDLFIHIDQQKLRQILYNLLSNAVKFTIKGEIHLGYTVTDNRIEIFVKDTGIGIDKVNHEQIFKRFGQVETDLSNNMGGTGLGLSICKGYVALLQGTIRLESEVGKGSVFYVSIPLNKAERLSETTKSERSEIILEKETKILIAEDNDRNYFYLEELLHVTNITLIRAVNGKNAVEMCLADKSISLVLMDVKMPVMNGLEATMLIKKSLPDLPIVALTAFAAPEDKEEALKSGCDYYLSKPIDSSKLFEILRMLLLKK